MAHTNYVVVRDHGKKNYPTEKTRIRRIAQTSLALMQTLGTRDRIGCSWEFVAHLTWCQYPPLRQSGGCVITGSMATLDWHVLLKFGPRDSGCRLSA